jgi:hypothetical protein
VQTGVDAKHDLIVEHEVTNNGSDRDQLSGMAKKARTAIGTTTLTAIADRGYFKGEEILACHEAGICTLVPPTKTSGAKADGRFDKADFIYDPLKNEYRCPAGESLIWRFASVEKGMTNHRYWRSNCKACPLKDKCTPSSQRRVTRWEHQDVLDEMQSRLEQAPDAMRIRRSTVEHLYATIKAWMGATHFLTKGLERVKAEMSLHVLAYNFRRLMAILGIERMLAAIRAYAHFLTLQGLPEAFSLLALIKISKSDYAAWTHCGRSARQELVTKPTFLDATYSVALPTTSCTTMHRARGTLYFGGVLVFIESHGNDASVFLINLRIGRKRQDVLNYLAHAGHRA